jgi:hypothetical protein
MKEKDRCLVGHVFARGGIINVYKIFVNIPRENTLMRRKIRCEDNIKLDIRVKKNGLNLYG